LKEAFQKAQILKQGMTWEEESSHLLQLWAKEHHQWCALTIRPWKRMLAEAEQVFISFCKNDELYSTELPHALTRQLQADLKKEEQQAVDNVRHVLIEALETNNCIPKGPDGVDVDKLRNREDQEHPWVPSLVQLPHQSKESFEEQTKALKLIIESIDDYIAGKKTVIKSPLLIGVPGAGKTHLMILGLIYALSRKLEVVVLSLTGKRALSLGGMHMHDLFCMQESIGAKTQSAIRMAETCLVNLQRQPAKLAILRSADILAFEEIGMISQENLATMMEVTQKVCNSQVPFGGKLFLATGDARQLPPVTGKPFWTHTSLLYLFKPCVLRNYVRCAEDSALQKLNNLLHQVNTSHEDNQEIDQILRDNVPAENYHSSWADVPASVKCIVPLRRIVDKINEECVKARMNFIKEHNQSCTNPSERKEEAVSIAEDTVETTPGASGKPDKMVKKQLNRTVLETDKLYLSEGGVYNFTFNDKRPNNPPRFTQGQSCVIRRIIPPVGECNH
jgi:hypothetical protein